MTRPIAQSGSLAVSEALYELVEDLTDRLQRDEPIELEAIVAAHPEHADELRKVWPSLALLAGLKQSAGSRVSFPPGAGAGAAPLAGEIGDFRIIREVGRGGMGIVYEAEQMSLGRKVALKVLPFAGVLDERQLQRFRNEARAAAGLHHPHIVPVHAVGCERGVHYYAMQFIEGRNLAEEIDDLRRERGLAVRTMPRTRNDQGLTNGHCAAVTEQFVTETRRDAVADTDSSSRVNPRQVAEWIIQAARALDYAHSVGIVHRDIKPSNLLLDSSGQLWVTDFGLAQFEADAGLTQSGDILGTLRYMSPEQALGPRGVVDQRADVYSLGATLYELLTLSPLFPEAGRAELLRCIEQEDPQAPRRSNPAVGVELETIVLKSLAKDTAARYATAGELADDLQRYLEDRPIVARRPAVPERLLKWTHRHGALVGSLLAGALVSIIGLVIANIIALRHQDELIQQRNAAALHELRAVEAEHVAEERARAISDRESVIREYLYVADVQLANQWYLRGGAAREQLERHVPGVGEDDKREFVWHYLSRLTRDEPQVWLAHTSEVFRTVFSPDGTLLATCGHDRKVIIWNVGNGTPLVRLENFTDDINAVAFSADGKTLATAEENRMARLWDWKSGQEIHRFTDFQAPVAEVFFAEDGDYLITAETDWGYKDSRLFRTKIWNLDTREQHAVLDGFRALAVHQDQQLLAACNAQGELGIWKLPDFQSESKWSGNSGRTYSGTFSGNGEFLITCGGSAPTIRIWDVDTLSDFWLVDEQAPGTRHVAITPDGSHLISTHDDGTARLWELRSRTLSKVFPSVAIRLWGTAVSPDGRSFVVGRDDGAILVRSFNSVTQGRRTILRSEAEFESVAFDPMTNRLAIADGSSKVSICSANAAVQAATAIHLEPHSFDAISFSPDGCSIWLGDRGGAIRHVEFASGDHIGTYKLHEHRINALQIAPGGLRVMSSDINGTEKVWDLPDGRIRLSFPTDGSADHRLLGYLDDDTILSTLGPHHRTLEVTDVAKDRIIYRLLNDNEIIAAAVSPDRRSIAAGDGLGIRLWDVSSGQPRKKLVDPRPVVALAFSPDGRTLASATDLGVLKLWHVPTGEYLYELSYDRGPVQLLAFTRDGRHLLCAVDGHSIFAWDAE